MALPHANVQLPTGELIVRSALFAPILADHARAGVRPPQTLAPQAEQQLMALPQLCQCCTTEVPSNLEHRKHYRAGCSSCGDGGGAGAVLRGLPAPVAERRQSLGRVMPIPGLSLDLTFWTYIMHWLSPITEENEGV